MKRYCIVGVGGRGIASYGTPLVESYGDVAEIVALCDVSLTRLNYAKEALGIDVPVYTDFDQMLKEVPCDVVIVTTTDATHHKYVIKALEAGRDAITEKPMTTEAEYVRAILEAERRTGRRVDVTFNMRYDRLVMELRRQVMSGVIGNVQSAEMQWTLNTLHGADYYRRWHSRKEHSGGLLIHKSTHHFDMVNWILDAEPQVIYANGNQYFYGPNRAERGERCMTCDYKKTCEFFYDITASERAVKMYVDAEGDSGYIRDSCVFSPDIDIEDTVHLTVKYTNDILFNYSLVTYAPFEGYRLVITGDKGRLEVVSGQPYASEEKRDFRERSAAMKERSPWIKSAVENLEGDWLTAIRVYPTYGGEIIHPVPRIVETGGHGGSDTRLRDLLFRGIEANPELGQHAGSWEGAMSVLIGVGANESIKTGQAVNVADMLGETLVPDRWIGAS